MKAPKAPDPMETAQAQAGMNRDTAITQHQLNMVNQYTPYGNLVYSQTGSAFAPSETGQDYYYNPSTGEYRTDRPTVIGSVPSASPAQTTGSPVFDRAIEKRNGPSTDPVFADGWQKVKGNLTPQYSATQTFSPEQQKIFDETQKAQQNLAQLANEQSGFLKNYLGEKVNLTTNLGLNENLGLKTNIGGTYSDKLGGAYTTQIGGNYTDTYAGADDFSADRQRHEDAILARLAPRQQRDEATLRNQLIQSGIRPGTAAWDSEYARLQSGVNDARLGAILAGGDEQARMVGMARDAAMFGNQANLLKAQFGNEAEFNRFQAQNAASLGAANFYNDATQRNAEFANAARERNAAFNNAATLQQRNQPINELMGIMSGAQVQAPNYVNTPQTSVGGVDYTGLVNQKYQGELASYQSGMGGLFGLGSALVGALPFSDRRLKENVTRIGQTDGGTPIYSYNYVGGGPVQFGVMADEVPEAAVFDADSGFFRVDYSKVK